MEGGGTVKTSSAKGKGRRLQQRIVRDILAAFPHLTPDDVTSRSMGASGVDVLLSPAAQAVFPFAVESKNCERIALWQAQRQAEANATATLAPLLVVARNRTEPLAVLPWNDLVALLQRNRSRISGT